MDQALGILPSRSQGDDNESEKTLRRIRQWERRKWDGNWEHEGINFVLNDKL